MPQRVYGRAPFHSKGDQNATKCNSNSAKRCSLMFLSIAWCKFLILKIQLREDEFEFERLFWRALKSFPGDCKSKPKNKLKTINQRTGRRKATIRAANIIHYALTAKNFVYIINRHVYKMLPGKGTTALWSPFVPE